MIKRTLHDYLLENAGYYPVVTLTGPRQSGKTTLVKEVFPMHEYVSLEETELRLFARDNPREFLKRYSGPVIIDEVQRVPELFSYMQSSVDENGSGGRFILTGSQNFLLMEKISQSLAGRCAILHLLPFSHSELRGWLKPPPDNVENLFCTTPKCDSDVWKTLYQGFYPRIHDRSIPPEIWLADYIQTYLQRDVRQLVNIGDMERFERFLSLVAGRVGQILNYSNLAHSCGITVDTAKRWISVLKTSFIVFLVQPHHKNFNKRIIKSPKLYFYDTGLVCHLLRIRNPEQAQLHPLRGALFENLIISEVTKTYFHHRREPPIFFWRDQTGHEVDLLIENNNKLFPIEIKSSQTVSKSMFDALKWWCKQASLPIADAMLIYGGDNSYIYDDISVRPWYSI